MFKPVNDLELDLVRAAEEPEARAPFLKTLLDAELAFALARNGGEYQAPELESDGTFFVPIFTSEERVKEVFGREKMTIVRQTFRQIVEQIADANFVLNPGSDYGREIMQADVAAMLAGDFETAAASLDDDQDGPEAAPLPTAVGRPSPAPTHLTGPLAKLFATIPEVRAAHFAQAVFPDPSGVKRLVLGVATDGDLDEALDRVSDVLDEVARPSDVIDFVPVPGSPLDFYFERDTSPFYKRAST